MYVPVEQPAKVVVNTQKLKELRQANELGTCQLVNALREKYGCQTLQPTYSAIENGKKKPTLTLMLSLAKFFNVPVEELCTLPN